MVEFQIEPRGGAIQKEVLPQKWQFHLRGKPGIWPETLYGHVRKKMELQEKYEEV